VGVSGSWERLAPAWLSAVVRVFVLRVLSEGAGRSLAIPGVLGRNLLGSANLRIGFFAVGWLVSVAFSNC
jgi:hypothetical protein